MDEMMLCDSKQPAHSGPGSSCSRFYIRSYLKILKNIETIWSYSFVARLPSSSVMMYLLIGKLYLIALQVRFWDSSWEKGIVNGRPRTGDLWCQNFSAPEVWSPGNHNQKYFRQRLKIHVMDSLYEKDTERFYMNGCIYKVLAEVFPPCCPPNPNPPKKY